MYLSVTLMVIPLSSNGVLSSVLMAMYCDSRRSVDLDGSGGMLLQNGFFL